MTRETNSASLDELHLVSEEDVKARVILPWLAQLGFGPEELTFETKFTVTIGRDFGLTLGEDRSLDKNAYADIVCYRGGEPLMVVEVKRDDIVLGEREREQAISYARLLPRIAPYAVVANSTTAHVYDVVTRAELTTPTTSSYARSGRAIELDPELRAIAARALVTFSPSTLLELCRQQHRFYLAPLIGAPRQDRVYSEELFEPREGSAELLTAFWASSSRCLALVGPSGVGKTSFLCWLTERDAGSRPIFFYDVRMLTHGLAGAVVGDFAWLVGRDATAEQVLSRLSDLSVQLETEFLIVLDAADEQRNQEATVVELDQLLRRTQDQHIRFALSAKTSEWPNFLSIRGTPTTLIAESFGQLPSDVVMEMPGVVLPVGQLPTVPGTYLPPLNDQELDRAWSRYRRVYRVGGVLAGEVRERARLPFSMRIVAEAYAESGQLPVQWTDYVLLDRWLQQRLARLPDSAPARRAAGHLAAAMVARDENLLTDGTAVATLVGRGFAQPEYTLGQLVRAGILLRAESAEPGSLLHVARIVFPHDRFLLYLYIFAEQRWHELSVEDQRRALVDAAAGGRLSRAAATFFVEVLLDYWSRLDKVGEHTDDLPSLVRDLQQPLGLVNAVRRASLSLLQGNSGVDGWLSLLNGFEASGLSPRWRQSVLLAPLSAAGTPDLLERLTPTLVADDGALLRELLSAALTLEVWPNIQLLSVAARVARRPSEIPVLLYQEPVPNLTAWSPLITWLVPRLASLPEQCRDECAQAMLLWQRSTPQGAPYRKEIGSQAAQWLVSLDELRLRRWSADDDERSISDHGGIRSHT